MGVMRSTMALGKLTWRSIHCPNSASRKAANASSALRVTAPSCGRLSQDIRVNAGVPAARRLARAAQRKPKRSEEHTSELQSLMRISYAVFCLKKKKKRQTQARHIPNKNKQ